MRTITKEELDIILKKHLDFLQGVAGGEQANLSYADLYLANLQCANLRGAVLHRADLHRAYLYGADLRGAILSCANLQGANLRGADLICANLHGANLRGADLICANLHGANLRGAVLSCANLYGTNLRGANLHDSYLTGANIATAFLDEKEQPRKGTILKKKMIGYKKLADGSICVLSIPKGAIVFCINGLKCRTNKAKVLDGGGVSCHDHEFTYEKGKMYEIEDFDPAYNEECSTGIHFFKTRKEAEDY